MSQKTSKVNHPSHYQSDKGECIEVMLDTFGPVVTGTFCLTNAYKCLFRRGEKAGESYYDDTKRAIWYINFFCDRIHPMLQNTRLLNEDAVDAMIKLLDTVKEMLKEE